MAEISFSYEEKESRPVWSIIFIRKPVGFLSERNSSGGKQKTESSNKWFLKLMVPFIYDTEYTI